MKNKKKEKLQNKKLKLENSFFIINKLYIFIGFLILSFVDFALGLYSVLISMVVLLIKTLKAELPIKIKKDFKKKTYVYKKTEDRKLKLDLWYPDKPSFNLPLVYFCHGGGWISGFRNQPNNISWCKFLADKGFVVCSIDYRYGYSNNMADILSDYIDGLEFLRSNSSKFGINKDNITLMGLSAGGHLSLLYASYFTKYKEGNYMDGIKSVVGYYPPTNLKDILIDEKENKSLFADYAIKKTLEGSPTDIDDVYDFYSPISYLTEDMIPTLLVHGQKDTTVPIKSSEVFNKKLSKLGVPHEFLVHTGADHSFDTRLKDYQTVSILNKTVTFIKNYSR